MSSTAVGGGNGPAGGTSASGRRPTRPKLELNLPSAAQETSSDTEDTEKFLLMLDKLRRAKQLLAESKEKKRKREILSETMTSFYKESTTTMQKYIKLCQDKKKQLIADGEKLRSDIASMLERLDRRIESYDKFVTSHAVRLEEAERQMQSFEHKLRRDFNESDRMVDAELDMMRTAMDDKLEEIKRVLTKTAKKAKKKETFAQLLRQLLEER